MTTLSPTVSKQRPYLLRAMHEWMTDNLLTPHIVVDATKKDLSIPREHIEDGKLILNLSFSATRNLAIGNDCAEFEARFGGVSRRLSIPVSAIMGIYARETGQGMVFSDEDSLPDSRAAEVQVAAREEVPEPKRPNLKIVK